MNPIPTKLTLAGLLFLLTLLSGAWVSHSGRPVHVLVFTIHKLIALAAVIAIAMIVYNLYQAQDLRTLIELAVIVSTGLLFLALFITGALLSRDSTLPAAILRVHQVAPLLALVSATVTIYLLVSSNA